MLCYGVHACSFLVLVLKFKQTDIHVCASGFHVTCCRGNALAPTAYHILDGRMLLKLGRGFYFYIFKEKRKHQTVPATTRITLK